LIDASMAEALDTMTEEDEQPFTIQITVNYMKPGKPGTLTATAQVRKGARGSPSSRPRWCRRRTP
jgi:acyl-coenzyme A thioesterase PaaI-like protein